ncbi:hypothetical protein HJ171_19660 [Vibrio parahaemolyticus]|uniref:restriction endonuclease subunit S n=1 Tax=Vibrio parahaemolyticus TaxID=670 RepID=UPI00111F3F3A|nr:restriction endonuclease subunit S [Vibrio parahaemolyticus]EGQ9297135.1 hypothetical protein [Vibrio parahaemolyticus]MBE3839423.1 hypothetical protein [Vibrio parahaemolyticus]MBM4891096.1 restriction endonuclease subunit S [Vibrio parahaemolyticus]TOA78995.1 hypothetical protein CGK19_13425 [Vibrio parahaemolyticus]TOF29084.1 hypothetical protein CGJ25_20415 [Vibrio parahaemolyticus]
MTEQMNVPKLRFNGFEGDWISHRINDVSECVTSGSRDWAKYYSDKGDKFVRMTNLGREGINLLLEDMRYVSIPTGGSEGQRTSLQENDILISITAELGKIGIIPKDFGTAYINQHTALVRVNQQVNAKFLAQNLATKKSNKKINRLNDSGAKSGLNLSTIRNFEFTAPTSLPEQKKIASFLSKVDEKIALLTEKKDKLTEYKKGVMQQLFNGKWEEQDGQLTFIPPTLRFKADDGSEFPDWEEKALGDFSRIYDGTHQTPKYVDEGVPFYSVEHVTANQFEKTKYISEEVYAKECKRVTLKKGDILLTRIGSVGDVRLIDWDVRASFYVSLALVKYNDEIVGQYLASFMESPNFQSELWKRMIHVAFPKKINLGEIGHCLVSVPSRDEQTKIANFLSAIAQKIDLANSELENAKEWKKGLLQQMFV